MILRYSGLRGEGTCKPLTPDRQTGMLKRFGVVKEITPNEQWGIQDRLYDVRDVDKADEDTNAGETEAPGTQDKTEDTLRRKRVRGDR